MTQRRKYFSVAFAFMLVFGFLVLWALVAQPGQLRGNVICAEDAASARLLGGDRPGVYTFDTNTGRAVTIPPSMAFMKLLKAIFVPSYSGEASCAFMELQQGAAGLAVLVIAASSLAGAFLGLLAGVFARSRT